MMRTFAAETSVPVSRTRAEIDDLLRNWKCTKIGWTDEFDERRSTLQFMWIYEEQQYLARFKLELPKREAFIAQWKKKNGSWSNPVASTVEKSLAQGERQAYRVLLLKIKGDLNAVEAGIVTAAQVFLSWLVTADGRTVAEALVPRLQEILTGSAERLLPSGKP